MDRYFVKAPISGWHEVDKDHFESFVNHVRKNATPVISMEELIKRITKKTRQGELIETGTEYAE
jgi:hypothetical protein